ncbi:DUF4303 domain-containing protein [Shewanella algae]|uniref:DUF4303 domain-containing protein n=1 Tax=Shewanella algae TaxID=38313 RepID=UPI0030074F41
MEPIKKHDLVDALVSASIPSIEKFFEEHAEEKFFGFAVEILAEEGYFHVCASSEESFQSTIDSYSKSGESMEEIMGEGIRWNNQEWQYFDLNYDCQIWQDKWESMIEKLNKYKEHMRNLIDSEWGSAQEEFSLLFQSAGEEAYRQIIDSGVLNSVTKTHDFRAWVFEHHDVF